MILLVALIAMSGSVKANLVGDYNRHLGCVAGIMDYIVYLQNGKALVEGQLKSIDAGCKTILAREGFRKVMDMAIQDFKIKLEKSMKQSKAEQI